MQTHDPLVSIITPSYNSERFISEAIESVINQTYLNWELLITDDCSSDNSVKIIKEYIKQDKRIKLFSLSKNSGAGPARNRSIKESRGKYIAFLDSDDIWVKQRLEEHISFMEERNAAFSHTSYGFINEKGEVIKNTYRVSDKPIEYKDLLKKTEISCLTAIYNQEYIGKFYMPSIRRKQDYALWLSILKTGVKSFPLDKELAFYRQHSNSATNKKAPLLFKHYFFLRRNEQLSIFNSLLYTLYWIIGGLRKYYFLH